VSNEPLADLPGFRAIDRSGELQTSVEIAPSAPPRIVGPGRRERDYLKRVTRLEDLLLYERERQRILENELEVSQRVERGAQRRLDRLEQRLEVSFQREKRLAVLIGALQRENELLQRRVIELESANRVLEAPRTAPVEPRRGLWARVFGRGSSERRPRGA
jgi:hypothetical protein